MVGKDIETLAIPTLAGSIEFGKGEEEIEQIIADAFKSRDLQQRVILGCTHYPLVLPLFKKVAPTAQFFDPAIAVAERAEKLFWPQEVGEGTSKYLVSKDSAHFRHLVTTMFPDTAPEIEVIE
jgi:glutamate racemase